MRKPTIFTSLIFFSFLASAQLSSPNERTKVITVNNADEFIQAIGSDRTIQLNGPIYLPDVSAQTGANYRFVDEYDGNELLIFGVRNLKIIGIESEPTKIITRPQYGDVLAFDDCTNVTIENVNAGHGPLKGSCTGGVFNITNSRNFFINNSILFGSGIEGITANTVTGLICTNTTISGCSYGIMTLENSNEFEFNNCVFTDNEEFDLVNISNSIGVKFNHCSFDNNRTTTDSYSEYALFSIYQSTGVVLENCRIENNKTVYFSRNSNSFEMKATTLNGNTFTKGNFKN